MPNTVKALSCIKKVALGLIIGPPVIVLTILFCAVAIPVDIIHYHTTRYYKEQKHKYKFGRGFSREVKLYDYIARKKLPVEYFDNDGYEYFVKDGVVLLTSFINEELDEDYDKWYYIQDEDPCLMYEVPEIIESEHEYLYPQHGSLPAKLLYFCDDEEEHRKAKDYPYFCCLRKIEEIC